MKLPRKAISFPRSAVDWLLPIEKQLSQHGSGRWRSTAIGRYPNLHKPKFPWRLYGSGGGVDTWTRPERTGNGKQPSDWRYLSLIFSPEASVSHPPRSSSVSASTVLNSPTTSPDPFVPSTRKANTSSPSASLVRFPFRGNLINPADVLDNDRIAVEGRLRLPNKGSPHPACNCNQDCNSDQSNTKPTIAQLEAPDMSIEKSTVPLNPCIELEGTRSTALGRSDLKS